MSVAVAVGGTGVAVAAGAGVFVGGGTTVAVAVGAAVLVGGTLVAVDGTGVAVSAGAAVLTGVADGADVTVGLGGAGLVAVAVGAGVFVDPDVLVGGTLVAAGGSGIAVSAGAGVFSGLGALARVAVGSSGFVVLLDGAALVDVAAGADAGGRAAVAVGRKAAPGGGVKDGQTSKPLTMMGTSTRVGGGAFVFAAGGA